MRESASRPTPPVAAFEQHGEDGVLADDLAALVAGMNRLAPHRPLDVAAVERRLRERDDQVMDPRSADPQARSIRRGRATRSDRFTRVAAPHRILDPEAGPLVAVRQRILTRKTLGGIQTDLAGRALRADGLPFPGLVAAGEVAGFGGGGHGDTAL